MKVCDGGMTDVTPRNNHRKQIQNRY